VATIKHHHSEFPATLDVAGTDTWRHRKAGASCVALMSPTHVAIIREFAAGDSLERMLESFQNSDIVLVEGFHQEPQAKIEVLSRAGSQRICAEDDHLIALVGSDHGHHRIPCYAPDAIGPLADLIETAIVRRKAMSGAAGRARIGVELNGTPG
jgi:molybdopterin-guanine dinucleotide biosynthesis protein B